MTITPGNWGGIHAGKAKLIFLKATKIIDLQKESRPLLEGGLVN